MSDPYMRRLLQAVVNVILADHGEPEPIMTDSVVELADKLDLIARRLRLEKPA